MVNNTDWNASVMTTGKPAIHTACREHSNTNNNSLHTWKSSNTIATVLLIQQAS
jgi:hypothetical protein